MAGRPPRVRRSALAGGRRCSLARSGAQLCGGHGTEEGTKFLVTDPWSGEYERTIAKLDRDFSGAAGAVGNYFQILHR